MHSPSKINHNRGCSTSPRPRAPRRCGCRRSHFSSRPFRCSSRSAVRARGSLRRRAHQCSVGRHSSWGADDIQLGVNESMRDSARVIGGMCQGIFARVGDHSEIEVCLQLCSQYLLTSFSGIRSTLTGPRAQRPLIALAPDAGAR